MKSNKSVPSAPDYLTHNYDLGPIFHEPKNIMVEYQKLNDVTLERQTAETNFAELYSQQQELLRFNKQLLKKIRTFERYQDRIRKNFDEFKRNEKTLFQTSKLLQKDHFIAERTIEDLQIENESLLGTVQTFEEKLKLTEDQVRKNEAVIESLSCKIQTLDQKLDDKTIELAEAEEQLKLQLFQTEKITNHIADLNRKFRISNDDVVNLKLQLEEARVREDDLLKLNSNLVASFEKNKLDKTEPIADQEKKDLIIPKTSELLSDFSKRWTHVIDQLSSHSGRLSLNEEDLDQRNLSEKRLNQKGAKDLKLVSANLQPEKTDYMI